ncbi:protein-glutamate methylesterase/protein-glutamine glutaminase [Chengkuizengella axinellae]|uniref:Protein-glutamate methylesterase/protein-glutamine glutaminase n=1 Tax=Chengkuizengella axinellae TaxID=3064388 RepID=A0ABT9IVS1_9BACL|nr:chemotaxis response regulator protein-glutamate methylesterase [Chengkuizengella sp. 2205SS18-9]MDP5273460.1 chemotaxis response regulator protein-glutamate methylesterase [Chengkuizengella sp. 2205SS18-9]
MARYRVIVVDDSAFMRNLIKNIIFEESEFEVVYSAKNGKEAVDKVLELKPDVVTMDIEMPIMNGLEALQKIMENQPTPVLMLSNLTDFGTAETIKALQYGAVDFVKKPSLATSLNIHKHRFPFMDKLRNAVQSNVKRHLPSYNHESENSIQPLKKKGSYEFEHLVALGTSTGGPRALQQILTSLPESFTAPILIVQHMPPKFTKSLAERLNMLSPIRVVEAEHGQELETASAYIAPGDWHMGLKKEQGKYKIHLSKEELRTGHRPSVDYLFESLVPFQELEKHIVIMTGMGSDGAEGMKLLIDSGVSSTIVESEESCIIYGMPRAATEMNDVDYVLSIDRIAPKLVDLVTK